MTPEFLKRLGRSIERSALTTSRHRLVTLLLFVPPTMGALLGGAAVRLASMSFLGHPVKRPDLDISVGMFACSFAILFFFWRRSLAVYGGSPTVFPRAFRAVPWTSLAGLALGLVGALQQALRR